MERAVGAVSAAAEAGLGQGEAAVSAMETGSGQGETAALVTDTTATLGPAATATATEAAVGLLPRSSLSSHLRGSSLLLISNDG